MWTQQFGVYSCLSRFKLQFILDENTNWTYDQSIFEVCGAIISGDWEINQRTDGDDCPRFTGTSLCGENHLCCVIELFESWNPKTTSFLTRCYVWEASVQNQFKPGNTLSQRIGSNRRRTDGIRVKNSQGFTTLGILTEIQKMMAELKCEPKQFHGRSSSCTCTTTSNGELQEM